MIFEAASVAFAWLGREFQWSERSARRFMLIAEKFKSANLADFSGEALYLLAGPSVPPEVREEAAERAEAGETITKDEAGKTITKIEAERAGRASLWSAIAG
jgi:hypothetical protein